ncbi:hypothetical protein C9374_013644 [Naegleria lovaniensis]|uniref:Exonuclease domain-containing protein n=1 Tax=Naegleria lovaniensis TaxID=51637 RepID=A0AA88GDP3_NAELO|nr:uncharacterized protein C9374_013644 [Naegleria lovaniensis]KAG2372689.1 hypothetical protein C9374_013644 [Naegleria lovaniensis]
MPTANKTFWQKLSDQHNHNAPDIRSTASIMPSVKKRVYFEDQPFMVENITPATNVSYEECYSELKYVCRGINRNNYSKLLTGKQIYNCDYDIIGVIRDELTLESACCSKYCSIFQNQCRQCSELEKHLVSIMENRHDIFEMLLKGILPQPKQLISFPLLMYELLCKLVPFIPVSQDEHKLLTVFRKAQTSYNEALSTQYNNKQITNNEHRDTQALKVPRSSFTPFLETFFGSFIFNQLQNYAKNPFHHKYSEVERRYWVVMKYYCGKQFFIRMGGERNQNIERNNFNHLKYNLIIPSWNTVKQWTPAGCYGMIPDITLTLKNMLLPDSCKDTCISFDGMKVFKHFDVLGDQIVGSEKYCYTVEDVKQFGVKHLIDQMILFSINAIDNSWHLPLGWFGVSSETDVLEFVTSKILYFKELLQESVTIVCGCSDAEIDAHAVQTIVRKKHKDFIFVNDYVHNFKNQRNVLFNGTILHEKISMQTIIYYMIQHRTLYRLLDREEVDPTDIMNLKSCLNLTERPVLQELRKIGTIEANSVAGYLELIRDIYDCINDNSPDIIDILSESKTIFEKLPNYPKKTKKICVHTLEGFLALASRFPNFKPSCITTNYEELLFSIIRGMFPKPTTKQFCQSALFSFYIFLILHSTDDVRGFSLPDIPLTDHYFGMKLVIKILPTLPGRIVLDRNVKKKTCKELQIINQNVATYSRKTTLRAEVCAPKCIYLCCPVSGCKKQKPYIIKGSFTNHLKAKHQFSDEEAEATVAQLECLQFSAQLEKDVAFRKQSCKNNENIIVQHKPPYLISKFKNRLTIQYNFAPLKSIPTPHCINQETRRPLNFFVLDLETTGFSPKCNSIIQFAMLSLFSNELHSIFVSPSGVWSSIALQMHETKFQILDESETLQNMIPKICNYLTRNDTADVMLLVHSTGLDKAFFSAAIAPLKLRSTIYYCSTMQKNLLGKKGLENHFREKVCDSLPGIAHNAVVDVLMLYDLLLSKFGNDQEIVKAIGKAECTTIDD